MAGEDIISAALAADQLQAAQGAVRAAWWGVAINAAVALASIAVVLAAFVVPALERRRNKRDQLQATYTANASLADLCLACLDLVDRARSWLHMAGGSEDFGDDAARRILRYQENLEILHRAVQHRLERDVGDATLLIQVALTATFMKTAIDILAATPSNFYLPGNFGAAAAQAQNYRAAAIRLEGLEPRMSNTQYVLKVMLRSWDPNHEQTHALRSSFLDLLEVDPSA